MGAIAKFICVGRGRMSLQVLLWDGATSIGPGVCANSGTILAFSPTNRPFNLSDTAI